MKCVTILDPQHFSTAAMARLTDHFSISSYNTQTEILWLRLQKVSLDDYPKLECIATNCTGTDHIDLEECQRRGIEVLSLKGIEGLDTVHATAEHTISLMLQALRHRCDRSSGRIGRELHRKSVLLLGGMGRIGQRVLKMLEGFECEEILCMDPKRSWGNDAYYCQSPLRIFDIVSIHASLNETSKGMVNAEFLAKLKPGCVLVNTARDAIVDHKALFDWLMRDKDAIYAHDFSDDLPRWSHDHEEPNCRIIGTPHIGGWTLESLHKTEELLAERVIEWSKQRALETEAISR